jgi:aspartokinase/homoserine dehydrogenase 1
MQVLKFGGSSVGSAEAINQMLSIVISRIEKEKTIVVVSAMSGVTDELIILAQTAAQGNESYKTIIQNIQQKHLDAVHALVPNKEQSATISLVKQLINELESHSEALFMLKELSMRMQNYYLVKLSQLFLSQRVLSNSGLIPVNLSKPILIILMQW